MDLQKYSIRIRLFIICDPLKDKYKKKKRLYLRSYGVWEEEMTAEKLIHKFSPPPSIWHVVQGQDHTFL